MEVWLIDNFIYLIVVIVVVAGGIAEDIVVVVAALTAALVQAVRKKDLAEREAMMVQVARVEKLKREKDVKIMTVSFQQLLQMVAACIGALTFSTSYVLLPFLLVHARVWSYQASTIIHTLRVVLSYMLMFVSLFQKRDFAFWERTVLLIMELTLW